MNKSFSLRRIFVAISLLAIVISSSQWSILNTDGIAWYRSAISNTLSLALSICGVVWASCYARKTEPIEAGHLLSICESAGLLAMFLSSVILPSEIMHKWYGTIFCMIYLFKSIIYVYFATFSRTESVWRLFIAVYGIYLLARAGVFMRSEHILSPENLLFSFFGELIIGVIGLSFLALFGERFREKPLHWLGLFLFTFHKTIVGVEI